MVSTKREQRKKGEGEWDDSTFYNSYIHEELADFRKEAWQKQVLSHFDENKALKILDIGTGPGFFPLILAEKGHCLTGVDSSEGMLASAKENAEAAGLQIDFKYMDVTDLDFPEESFDLVTARNVIWNLQEPEKVYENIFRVLKKGGTMLIYDANWHRQYFDAEVMARVRQHEKEYQEKYGIEFHVCTDDEAEGGFVPKPLSPVIRPAWDVEVLTRIGFSKIGTDPDIDKNVYTDWEQELYQETPMFEICAVK